MTQNKPATLTNFPFSHQLKSLAKALLKNGDEIRLVGGCVRDFLLNKKIADIDLACKYRPEEVIEILRKNKIKVLPTGIKHGTVTAIIDGENFEITTLRQDIKTHGRKADVEFVDDYYLDAKRRDFTINSMSIDFSNKLYDYFGGVDDLKSQTVKFIGSASDRIREDYLRILRFFRFSCYYANYLNEEGLHASKKFKDKINELSSDRIRNELIKILNCPDRNKLIEILTAMQENSILEPIIISDSFDLKYLKNLLLLEKKLDRQFNSLIIFSAMIQSHKNQARKIAKKLNFSNKEISYIDQISNPDFIIDLNIPKNLLIGLLMDNEPQDILDALIINLSTLKINDKLVKDFLNVEKILTHSKKPKFPINGDDLLAVGIEPIKIGKALKDGKEYWINSDFAPDAQEIIEFIKKSCAQ